MTEPDDDDVIIAAPFRRMAAALALLPATGAADALPDWLAALLPPAALARPGRLILGVSVSGDGRRVTAQAINNADEAAPRLHDYLAAQAIPEAELDRVRLLGGRFHPPQIGVWHAWDDGGVDDGGADDGGADDGGADDGGADDGDAGWFFPVAFPFTVALAESPPQPAVAALRLWAEAQRIRISAGFGRAVLTPTRHSALQILLPGPEIDGQLAAAQAALAAVALPSLPAAVLEAVNELATGSLRLSIWLGDQGVIRMGLLVPRPVPALVTALTAAAPPAAPLAAFMAALDLTEPAVVECHQNYDSFGLTFHFNVPTHESG